MSSYHGQLAEHTLDQNHHSGGVDRMFLDVSRRRVWLHAHIWLAHVGRMARVAKKIGLELSVRMSGGAISFSTHGAQNDSLFRGEVITIGRG